MRRDSIFWGFILIAIAALLLLQRQGLLKGSIFDYIWPLVIVAFGLLLILGTVFRGKMGQSQQVSIPLEGAATAHVKIDHGAGRLTIRPGAAPAEVLTGVFGSGVEHTSNLSGDRREVRLKAAPDFWVPGGMDWEIQLNKEIPLTLKVDSGASATVIDLSELKVSDIDIDTGASSTELTLPASAGKTSARIDAGAASVKVKVPEGVSARIRIKSGLAGINVSARFPKIDNGLYQSADYETAANRAEVTIETGVGAVDIL
jgi:hypothetical protein